MGYTVRLESWILGGVSDSELGQLRRVLGSQCESILRGAKSRDRLLRWAHSPTARRDRYGLLAKHVSEVEAEQEYIAGHGYEFLTATLRVDARGPEEAMEIAESVFRDGVAHEHTCDCRVFSMTAERRAWLVFKVTTSRSIGGNRPSGRGGTPGVRQPLPRSPTSGSDGAQIPLS